MNLAGILERRAQVEAFLRQHRIGLLTLVFTDIVGSTGLKQRLGDIPAIKLIQEHHAVLREILSHFPQAQEISTAGDSFFLVFARPSDAARFALLVQAALRTQPAQGGVLVSDRIGIHIGEVMIEEELGQSKDLYGIQVDICARVMSLAEGGQILLTRSAFDNARQVISGRDLPNLGPLSWLNHGQYDLKGIDEPLEICELGETNAAPLKPPADSDKVHRHSSVDAEPVLGWRPAIDQHVPGTGWILEQKLGEGGFGEVWSGRHDVLKEHRVFKFCFRADRARSLKREVTLFRVLRERIGDHPNIVPVREVFFESPPYYLILDHAGADLKKWAETRRALLDIPLAERLEVVAQAADGLQAAHEAGVIHRDVKPSNILIRQESPGELEVRLTDFGIGQVVNTEALAGVTRLGFTQTLISPGSSAQTGTFLYMAPELIAGKPASTRSDIYSLGVVLYQMIIGDWSRPVTSDWTDHVGDPLLQADLKQCLAGRPEDRFAGAGQLAQRLRNLSERRGRLEREKAELALREKAAYRRGIVRTAAAASLLVAAMAALMLVAWQKSRIATQQTRLAISQAKLTQQLSEESQSRLVRLTTDKGCRLMEDGDLLGALLYFVEALRMDAGRPDAERLHRTRIGNILRHMPALTQCITSSHGFVSVAFSKDGSEARSLDVAGKVQAWKTGDGEPLSAAVQISVADGFNLRMSADGQRVLVVKSATDSLSSRTPRRFWLESWGVDGTKITQTEMLAGYPERFALSEDGRKVCFVSGGMIYYWKAEPGNLPSTPLPDSAVGEDSYMIALSSSGRYPCLYKKEAGIAVWDLEAVHPAIRKLADVGPVWNVVFDPLEEKLLTAFPDGAVHLWSLQTGKEVSPVMKHSGTVHLAVFNSTGALLAAASQDNTIRIWGTGSGALVAGPISLPRGASAMALSQDGRHLAAACGDMIRVWNTETGQPESPFLRTPDYVSIVHFSDDNRYLLVGGTSIQRWDLGRSQLHYLGPAAGSLHSLSFSPDNTKVITSALVNNADFWDPDLKAPSGLAIAHSNRIADAWFTTDSRRAITRGMGELALWDVQTGRRLGPKSSTGSIGLTCISKDGKRIAIFERENAPGAGSIHIYDPDTGARVGKPVQMDAPPKEMALSPDARFLAAASETKVFLWEVASGKPITYGFAPSPWSGLAFSPEGACFYVPGGGSRAWEESGGTGDMLSTPVILLTKNRPLISENIWTHQLVIDFCDDGSRLALLLENDPGAGSRTAQIWHVGQEKLLSEIPKIRGMISALQLDPAGRRVAVSTFDGFTRVWNADTGGPLTPALKHDGSGGGLLFFSRDGRTLVTASTLGKIRVWDADTGEPMGPAIPVGHAIGEAHLSPDGRFLVTLLEYQTQVWKLTPPLEKRPVNELSEIAHFLSGLEINAASDMVPLANSPAELTKFLGSYGNLRRAHPSTFNVAPEETRAWTSLRGLAAQTPAATAVITKHPEGKVIAAGEAVTLQAEAPAGSTFQWRFRGVPVPGATNRIFELKNVDASRLGSYSVAVKNNLGQAVSKAALVTFGPVDPAICGQWDFNEGNLSATIGYDLAYLGGLTGETAAQARFGSMSSFALPDLGSSSTARILAIPACSPSMGFVLTHDSPPNGAGAKLNRYTLIFDVLWENPRNQRFSAFAQLDDMSNLSDSDLFASWTNGFGGIGINEHYEGDSGVYVGKWHRVIFAIDCAGAPPVIAKYIDGRKHADQTEARGLERDGRFALGPTALLFTDENGETTPGFVNSVQLRNVKISDAEAAALGAPTPEGIPFLVQSPK